MPPSDLEARLNAAILSRGAIPSTLIDQCIRSDDLTAKDRLVEYLLYSRGIKNGHDLERYSSFILATLISIFKQNADGESLPTRFGVCEVLQAYFGLLTHWTPTPIFAIDGLVSELGLLAVTDPTSREPILLGFLEHILGHPGNAEYFAAWQRDEVLSAMLREGHDLSGI